MCPHFKRRRIAPKALHPEGTNVPQRKGVGRERQLIADAIAAKAEPGNTRPSKADAPDQSDGRRRLGGRIKN
jgi:hypothetical protein